MDTIFSQFDSLLTTSPGAIAFQFILLIITLLIFQDQLLQRSRNPAFVSNLSLGLSFFLVLIRLIFFLFSGVVWLSSAEPAAALPFLIRTTDILTLLFILWLTQFAVDSKFSRNFLIIFSFPIFLLGIALTIFWSAQNNFSPEGYGILFQVFEIIGFGIAGFGLLKSLRRREQFWLIEVSLFGLPALAYLSYFFIQQELLPVSILISHLFTLILLLFWSRQQVLDFPLVIPVEESKADSGVIERLSQSIINEFPGVDTTPLKITEDTEKDLPPKPPAKGEFTIDDLEFDWLVKNILSLEEKGTSQGLSTLIGKYYQADHCMILINSLESNTLELAGFYSKAGGTISDEIKLTREDIPGSFECLSSGRPLHILPASASEDTRAYQSILQTRKTGMFLILPIISPKSSIKAIITIHAQDEKHSWKTEDQLLLEKIVPSIANTFSGLRESKIARSKLFTMEEEHEILTTRQQIDQMEKDRAVEELGKLKETFQRISDEKKAADGILEILNLGERTPDEYLAEHQNLLTSFENIQSEMALLQEESENMKVEVPQLREELNKSGRDLEVSVNDNKLAMAELSTIKDSLRDANKQITHLKVEILNEGTSIAQQTEVIASMSQELRQPLQSILGYTDLLLEESVGILGALQKKFLDRVRSSTEKMNNLLEDLIKMATIESGEIELKPVLVNLAKTIDAAVNENSIQIMEKEIQLRIDLEENLPDLPIDQDALEQILNNLIANACKANPVEGEMEIRAVLQSEDSENQFILIQIKDSGGGIANEDITKVFSRVYRADNPMIEGVGETGVGLSIAKTLTEALNGRIWVESEMGTGSIFSVLLNAYLIDGTEKSFEE